MYAITVEECSKIYSCIFIPLLVGEMEKKGEKRVNCSFSLKVPHYSLIWDPDVDSTA